MGVGPPDVEIAEQRPRLRSFQVSAVLAGGLAPLAAVALLGVGGPWLVLAHIEGLAVITTAAALWSDETSRRDLRPDLPDPDVRARTAQDLAARVEEAVRRLFRCASAPSS